MRKILYSFILTGFFIFQTPAFGADLTLTGDVSGWHYINGAITTQGTTTVNTGNGLDLIAQTTVKFMPGFKVMPGGTLKAASSPDTDGDLVLDIVEQRSGCLDFEKSDTDDDGLADNAEDVNKNGIQDAGETLACDADTDNDRIPDGWEVSNGLDPLVDDTHLDPDKDTLVNYLEYYFKSDPQDASSLPPKGSYYEYDELGRIKKIIRIK